MLDSSLDLHPHVALRPEPFGALAYHYDTRKLVFLKHPDVVRVVQSLADHDTVADTLSACDIDERLAIEFRDHDNLRKPLLTALRHLKNAGEPVVG